MSALIRYDAARHALKVAQQVDEVKDIRDKAQALAAYARQAKDADMINWATEIKLRAERRCGELLKKTPRNKGDATPPDTPEGGVVPTLEQIGVSHKQSSDFQAIADIPEEEFEEAITEPKPSTASLVKKAKKKAEPKEKKPKPEKKAKVEKSEEEDNTLKELQAANKEILVLQAQSESLQKDDKDAEIIKLHKRIEGLEGRLASAITTKTVAEKDCKYATNLLRDIRKALKVEKNNEILQAIRES